MFIGAAGQTIIGFFWLRREAVKASLSSIIQKTISRSYVTRGEVNLEYFNRKDVDHSHPVDHDTR